MTIDHLLKPGAIVPIDEHTTKMLIDALKDQTYRNLVEVTVEDFNKMSNQFFLEFLLEGRVTLIDSQLRIVMCMIQIKH
jgi:hypothetical protein